MTHWLVGEWKPFATGNKETAENYRLMGRTVNGPYVPASALSEAIEIIKGLAEQQAMEDDWYVADLERLEKMV